MSHPPRARASALVLALCVLTLPFAAPCFAASRPALSRAEVEKIGRGIWKNECAGTVAGLTSWNAGEDFASLGIGHFIWYPAGRSGPFEESFPLFVAWLAKRGVAMPRWLAETKGCPWPDRASFRKDKDGPRQTELRALLAATVVEQTEFIMARLEAAIPRLEAAAGRSSARVTANVRLLRQTAAGNFAMIDYVNFKGDGITATERYRDQGWGLLDVLIEMEAKGAAQAPRAFADAAKRVLTRRVANSPPERKEKRWLEGWLNRCETYAK